MFATFGAGGRLMLTGTLPFDPAAIAIPEPLASLPTPRIGFAGGAAIDLATVGTFYVDETGGKNPSDGGPGWPKLACQWNDPIVPDGAGGWKVRT